MPKSIFISFILLACILLVFIHPVEEEEYGMLVSLVGGMFKKAKKRIKKGIVRIGMSEWIAKHHVPLQI